MRKLKCEYNEDCKKIAKYECEVCGHYYCIKCSVYVEYQCDCQDVPQLIPIHKGKKK